MVFNSIILHIYHWVCFVHNLPWLSHDSNFCHRKRVSDLEYIMAPHAIRVQIIDSTKFYRRRVQRLRLPNFRGMFYHYYKLFIALCFNLVVFNCFYIVFAFISASNTNSSTCIAIGVLLHFFLLSSFCLMISMSVLRCLMIIYVFVNIKHFNLISICCSYGKKTCELCRWLVTLFQIFLFFG